MPKETLGALIEPERDVSYREAEISSMERQIAGVEREMEVARTLRSDLGEDELGPAQKQRLADLEVKKGELEARLREVRELKAKADAGYGDAT
ncbi:MAG: hypothetical protein AAB897_04255 [Patescibacteria group bacterium]